MSHKAGRAALVKIHIHAMEAKERIFRAQDCLYDLTDEKIHRSVARRLARVRAELERLDNIIGEAQTRERGKMS